MWRYPIDGFFTGIWEFIRKLGQLLIDNSSRRDAGIGRGRSWRLAYLSIFTGFIEGRKFSTATRSTLARLVMDLERFENYPWGRVAFKVLMDSLWNKEIAGCYTVDGFIQVLQCGMQLCGLGASIGGPRATVRLHRSGLRGQRGRRSMKAAILSQATPPPLTNQATPQDKQPTLLPKKRGRNKQATPHANETVRWLRRIQQPRLTR
ncbi:hypothetical protein Bca52824_057897 [Brassica carinata]|uniref:DUF1985 domain-containing protein n=1 Tax=Brassica carinata TaxID=52824 RepID=A0A8X7UE26_BRACI|nr:hypothetical protein Bca52824_057897 [Brassica carinata]